MLCLYNVKIKMSEFGTAVHSYPNTTEYGYLKLEEIAFAFGRRMATRTRTALLQFLLSCDGSRNFYRQCTSWKNGERFS
jgi:hypothetical protein